MKHYFKTASVILAVIATCIACDKIKPAKPVPPQMQQAPGVSGQVNPQGEREAFAQTAQKELDELRGVIAEFKAKAETANLQTQAKLGQEVKKLETQWREAQQRLMELKTTTAESWRQLKESFSNSLDKLKNGVEAFRNTSKGT